MEKLREFYLRLETFFNETRKTSWGKNEVKNQIKDMYIDTLENEAKEDSLQAAVKYRKEVREKNMKRNLQDSQVEDTEGELDAE